MIDYLKTLSAEDMRLLGTFFGFVIAGIGAAAIGYRRGQPTPKAEAAASASLCKADSLATEMRELHAELDRIHERVIRIEDRTTRR